VTKLTPKQMRFVEEYCLGATATAAARAAGYSQKNPDVAATKLRALPHIKVAIERKRAKLAQKFEVTHGRVMRELSTLGYARIPKDRINGSDKNRALELMGKHVGMWTKEDEQLQRVGPGLTVIVQTAVQAQPGQQIIGPATRVQVQLPPPAAK